MSTLWFSQEKQGDSGPISFLALKEGYLKIDFTDRRRPKVMIVDNIPSDGVSEMQPEDVKILYGELTRSSLAWQSEGGQPSKTEKAENQPVDKTGTDINTKVSNPAMDLGGTAQPQEPPKTTAPANKATNKLQKGPGRQKLGDVQVLKDASMFDFEDTEAYAE